MVVSDLVQSKSVEGIFRLGAVSVWQHILIEPAYRAGNLGADGKLVAAAWH